MTDHYTDLAPVVARILQQIDGPLRVGAPLGIGKPHRLLNALYAAIEHTPTRPMTLYTALSLNPPKPGRGLQARFAKPFLVRHFGEDYPRLAYVDALLRDALPAHVRVEEFYMQSGGLLHSSQAQSDYTSLNYTHAAAAIALRAPNVIVQKVAREPDGQRLSLSCNNDITQDTLDAMQARGLARPLLVAEVDPQLPWIGGSAAVDAHFFDLLVELPGPAPRLFGLPRQAVCTIDYAIGLYASTLVRDGGTLQIGIGTLADALSHALVLRHTDNATYRKILHALDPTLEQHPTVRESGGLTPFATGLYGCSEMLNEGFKQLVDSGVIRRKVHDDPSLMQRLADGSADADDRLRLANEGQFLHGAFYLGSPEFYAWLRTLDASTRRAIDMRRISEINQLYGEESLRRLQRHDARFFNSCMMATALGAAVSDGLDDGRVVSGVGGQYNFVAMAHALPQARSVLMLRATRRTGADDASNIRWNYGHTTIPRHLRDVYITEYGIADVRHQTDHDCIAAMAGICDARFQDGLLTEAQSARKLRDMPSSAQGRRTNTPEALEHALAPFRRDDSLPDYPLGSDFTDTEQELLRALTWLGRATASATGKAATVSRALLTHEAPTPRLTRALQRMDLEAPHGLGDRLQARLLAYALQRTAAP
ncbi:acetyl-CoA hydrolase/transferase C-terminal domain-containing protein [Xanthomonas maliensis]|uniref:acetyl-CoA hydrolase/transferase C-terminal domain-containing protein n=1 Tax=Xanthomonas maliensis TaxID=1321368 RepID=UPI0003A3F4FD|nr:acetyl-CoA hydrolase/transferase C-terminal domain-containing protein [Xanthomonas maliensis]KAB7767509.1 acetyl-CoA hydrolase [Xanthomonas maliensis]